jgi:hypothetical protein
VEKKLLIDLHSVVTCGYTDYMETNTRFTMTTNRISDNGRMVWEVTDNERGYVRQYRTKKNALAAIASIEKPNAFNAMIKNAE